ncbi:hypothetical protein BGW38_004043, partial [Lunasporangiospora selenospora]
MAALGLVGTTDAHMAVGYPPVRGGPQSAEYDSQVHAFLDYNSKRKYPCNGYNKPIRPTPLEAGEVVNVLFWGPALGRKNIKLPSMRGKELNQARHGGGTCEFSISTDGGNTFHLIARYTKSCPDFYYKWPIKIPDNIPSCSGYGKCLLVWSWTAVNVPQFYMNCADITIKGKSDGRLPKKSISIVDIHGHKGKVMAEGDGYGDKRGR